jgi:hypothetical protein
MYAGKLAVLPTYVLHLSSYIYVPENSCSCGIKEVTPTSPEVSYIQKRRASAIHRV